MAVNPLQQYFRQPKIYISLPSQGVYNKLGSLSGDATNLPVCSMTGMDELIIRTPDALLTGESSVKVIESCCSTIKDAWELTTFDINVIFAAIRIATYGNSLTVTHTCPKCSTENQYEIDLTRIVEHYKAIKYNNKLQVEKITITTRPLTYKQSTHFALRNFQLQQKLSQAQQLTDNEEQQRAVNKLFLELSEVRNEIYKLSVESISVDNITTDDVNHIGEFLTNCDKVIFDALTDHVEKNRDAINPPEFPVICENCQSNNKVTIELDQSNFFA